MGSDNRTVTERWTWSEVIGAGPRQCPEYHPRRQLSIAVCARKGSQSSLSGLNSTDTLITKSTECISPQPHTPMIGERRRPRQRSHYNHFQAVPALPRLRSQPIDDSIASRDLHGLCARLSDQLSQERELGPFAPHRRSSDLPRQSRGLRPSHSRVGTLPALACADSSRRISDHKRCRVAGGTSFQLFCILLRVAPLLLSSLGRLMTDIRSCGGSHAASSTAAAGHRRAKSCLCTCYYRLVRLILSDAAVRPSPPRG